MGVCLKSPAKGPQAGRGTTAITCNNIMSSLASSHQPSKNYRYSVENIQIYSKISKTSQTSSLFSRGRVAGFSSCNSVSLRNFYFGLAIGSCLTVGGCAAGSISGMINSREEPRV